MEPCVGRNTLLPHTTKRRITTNLKTINSQKCQKIKLNGTLTTKELKKTFTQTGRRGRDRRWAAEWRGHAARQWTTQAKRGWLNRKLEIQNL